MALARLDEPVRNSLEALRSTIVDAFDTQGGAVGTAWPPLSARTLRTKQRLGYSAQPLVRTGALRDGWDVQIEALGSGVLASATPYARMHQEGTGRIPQRRFLPREEDALATVRQIFAQHVADVLDES